MSQHGIPSQRPARDRKAPPCGPILGLALLLSSLPTSEFGTGTAFAQDPWERTPQKEFLESPIVRKYQCVTCHTITAGGGSVGPILNVVGMRRSADWLREWLADPNAVKPGTKMPRFPFEGDELEQTVQYLSNMKRPLQTEEILASGAGSVEKGEALFKDFECLACHRVADEGRFVGPDLTWIGLRKPESWERVWLRDPPAFKSDTFMPNLHIPEKGVEHLAAYLHTLQGQGNDAGRRYEYQIAMFINTNAVFRGEMVWKRFGCWGCHGENGKGGIANPNAAAGHKTVPDMKGVRDKFDQAALRRWMTTGKTVPAKDPSAAIQPYNCPAYPADAIVDQDMADLHPYLVSLAPPKSNWTVKDTTPSETDVAAGEYTETEIANSGTIRGRVYFEEELPERERIQPSRDNDVCGVRLTLEGFVVDRDSKGLANAVVRLEGVAAGKAFTDAKHTIDQLECRYEPHVKVVRPGEQILITNNDPVLHNVHAYRGDDTVFNMAQPFQGQQTPQSIAEEGLVRVACDVHDWMEAWVLVLNNPYVAVTDSGGGFEIGDVPPGTYTVTLWQERLGQVSRQITVEAGGETTTDFVVVAGGG